MQHCEIERGSNDVLDAAWRPPARALGEGGLRFSSMPALTDWSYVVELRPARRGGAQVYAAWFRGHWRTRWRRRQEWRFTLSPEEFREIGGVFEAAFAAYRPYPPLREDGEFVGILCTDGPGYASERVRGGTVQSMAGSCPREIHGSHPNRDIAAAIARMMCMRVGNRWAAELSFRPARSNCRRSTPATSRSPTDSLRA